jgi:hypothetical protein
MALDIPVSVPPSFLNRLRVRSIAIACFLLIGVTSGCEFRNTPRVELQQRSHVNEGRDAIRLSSVENGKVGFAFGPRVMGPGQPLEHTYVVVNDTSRPVKVKEFVNAKPCCGRVEPIVPTTLGTGESIRLKVRIPDNVSHGPLAHRAILIMGGSRLTALELVTSGMIYPRISVERATAGVTTIRRGACSDLTFTAVSYTHEGESVDLEDALVEATDPCRWDGGVTRREFGGGIVEHRRTFVVSIGSKTDGGSEHSGEVTVKRGGEVLARQSYQWATGDLVRAIPAALLVRGGDAEMRLVVESLDQSRFEIVDAKSDPPGLEAVILPASGGVRHSVRVKNDKLAESVRMGRLLVRTTHALQPVVSIPFYRVPVQHASSRLTP